MDLHRLRRVLLLLIDRLSFFLPTLKPAQQSCRVFDSLALECDHRTGGRMFVVSRTVSDNELVTRQLLQVIGDVSSGDHVSAGDVPDVVGVLSTHVDDENLAVFY
jgi:hypothetical protein